ncbi:glycosyltransferase family 2 protein [Neobacillus sp. NPDC093127]|uniref:glycosyltransferase family 2 protein n=1 Tax=Neobacillus sp. NPDC093127 TaxID=3364296 RepID=UPI00380E8AA2
MENKARKRVLVGSPVHQKPRILREFLASLKRLKQDDVELSFFLIDDNTEQSSSQLLLDFKEDVKNVTVSPSNQCDDYICDRNTHHWNEQLIWKVADFKNLIIERVIADHYDYLFLVDSDLLLYPNTIEHLVKADKDIIAEIFWTKWQPHSEPQPQVWLTDEYKQWKQDRGERLTDAEISNRYQEFLRQMRTPGIYQVGGLGACTLISLKALKAGVNFQQISNLSFWGEDRHFCLRAAVLGFGLYVDTHFPAYHIYRESDLEGVQEFFGKTQLVPPNGQKSIVHVMSNSHHKLTLSMVVKNESVRYLKQVLKEHRNYIDEAVIIDDGSTDDTVDACLELLKGIPVHIVENKTSKFANEIELRKQQWEETLKTNPDWILNLDADEMFEPKFVFEVQKLLEQEDVDVFHFRLYDFWNDTHYREDRFWRSHLTYRPFLARFREHFDYTWRETPQHCGRFPENIFELPNRISPLRLLHFGWAKPSDRIEKFQRYMELDPEGLYGNVDQYLSILDENPVLIRWEE